MTSAVATPQQHWLVVLTIDKEPIRGLIEGVVPAVYKPTSEARWCMVKAETKARAVALAEESFRPELADDESVSAVSVSAWCESEVLDEAEKRTDVLRAVVADFDRRRSTRWGRFLLWLLRKTT
ncbi:MAG: hypothetical protein K0S82_81 [Gaiellaceae bacterium]|jgi:hypothetical protein|nr:hypothetical protein [Gaiellaceae bacterium]